MDFIIKTVIRVVLAIVIGVAIGSERARHGRAAGMRTHLLVCLGACMTSLTSMYVTDVLGFGGDVFRIPAQVVSGIGFLGAGMIILKSNNTITGLTTSAGVWTTATIGIALGYGYYVGAVTVAILFLTTTILFAHFEHRHKTTELVYLEIENAKQLNLTLENLKAELSEGFTYQVAAPKSGIAGNVGLSLVIDEKNHADINRLAKVENVVFAVEE